MRCEYFPCLPGELKEHKKELLEEVKELTELLSHFETAESKLGFLSQTQGTPTPEEMAKERRQYQATLHGLLNSLKGSTQKGDI